MEGGTISENTAINSGGGVYVNRNGTFTMEGGTISGNTGNYVGGGVYNYSGGTFTKTGGIIYGDIDNDPNNGNATDNTATSTDNSGTNGHAVFYFYMQGYYYRNTTLENAASGNINTTDELPANSGDTLNNWTKR
jgi:hypothetical protein